MAAPRRPMSAMDPICKKRFMFDLPSKPGLVRPGQQT
jgi:hypothetical protein